MGVQRGYLTYEEVNELMPPEIISPEAIDEIMNLLSENEIEVTDSAKACLKNRMKMRTATSYR